MLMDCLFNNNDAIFIFFMKNTIHPTTRTFKINVNFGIYNHNNGRQIGSPILKLNEKGKKEINEIL